MSLPADSDVSSRSAASASVPVGDVIPLAAWRWELTTLPWLHRLLRWRPLQFTLIATTLVFFILAILTSLLGTPVGNRNFGIIFV